MRAPAFALLLALLLAGCMGRPPHKDRSDEVSYNRRDLPPEPGLFTGCDGVWTVYRSRPDRAEPCPPTPGPAQEGGAPASAKPGGGAE
jgi:hypothetical protein